MRVCSMLDARRCVTTANTAGEGVVIMDCVYIIDGGYQISIASNCTLPPKTCCVNQCCVPTGREIVSVVRGIEQRSESMKPRAIYLDTSAVLAELLSEDVRPNPEVWSEMLCSSRLLEYEVWTSIHSKGLAHSHGLDATQLLSRVSFLELNPLVLARALEPFPTPLRPLDSLHLSSALFL